MLPHKNQLWIWVTGSSRFHNAGVLECIILNSSKSRNCLVNYKGMLLGIPVDIPGQEKHCSQQPTIQLVLL